MSAAKSPTRSAAERKVLDAVRAYSTGSGREASYQRLIAVVEADRELEAVERAHRASSLTEGT